MTAAEVAGRSAAALSDVTIYGAGVQGSMLAFRCAVHGKRVVLFDVDASALERAQQKIDGWLEERVRDGRLTEAEAAGTRQRVVPVRDAAAAVAAADIVIENVPERLEQKQAVWVEIDRLAPSKTLLTTNSSSLRSSEIGAGVGRRDRTFNVNFMTPTEDDLVEVMWNDATSEQTKQAAIGFLTSICCIPVVTKREIKGFSLNRVWRAMKKECLMLWSQGYVEPEDLDRAFMLEWKTTWGPFGLMDRVGLDVIRDIELSYYRESGDETDLPPQALAEMIAAGRLGEKSGRGFYEYPAPAFERPGWLTRQNDESGSDAQA